MQLISAEEAARFLHLNVKRVQALARSGRLPGRRVGRRWLFDRQDLERVLGAADQPATVGMDLSARNQLRGQVLAVSVDGVMAEVRVRVGDQDLVSIITRSSVERMGIRVGDPVVAVIKSTEIMIGKESGGR
jgi:molybdopterin-binding protein